MNPLDFAIKMELDGEEFYQRQADINKGNPLYEVCQMLAKDEARHAKILKNMLGQEDFRLEESPLPLTLKNIFNDSEDIKNELKMIPSQLDFYRFALDKEKQSIELYANLLKGETQPKVKEVYKFLLKQEKQHYETMELLVSMLMNADEWVESAEFGLRKDF